MALLECSVTSLLYVRTVSMVELAEQVGNPLIARLRLMTDLGDAELLAVHELLEQRREIRAGQDFVRAGQPTDRLHILINGWACRYKVLRDGQRQITALLLPGDPCDLDGVLVGKQDSSVLALTRGEAAVVSRDALLSVGRKYPRLADMLLWLTTLDNAAMSERLGSLGRRTARERLAHLFCEVLIRQAGTGLQSGDTCEFPLTQEAIGDTLGLTSVHVNRMVQALRKEGVIELGKQQLTVLDWPSLKSIAGFDPSYLHLSGMRKAPSGY